MTAVLPCAIYTRKSSEEGLEQDFNSLDAQREACMAFITSQKTLGWRPLPDAFDDGGYSGGNMGRPALQRLMTAIAKGLVKVVVVYKVDRLTRSLADFAKLVEQFDAQGVSFVSVTQQFNTTSSMGRLTLNVLLSFAQFEREVTGERIRDKIAASKKKGMWMGGLPPVGYRAHKRTLVIDEPQAERVREIYRLYIDLGCVRLLKLELDRRGWLTPPRKMRRANAMGERPYSRGHLHRILTNPIYLGQIPHKGEVFPGQHAALIDQGLWDRVQATIEGNIRGARQRVRAAVPSLLAGLLRDEAGNSITSSHAVKGVKRYRYYIRSADDASDTLRWPARELEEAVLRAIGQFLGDGARFTAAATVDSQAPHDRPLTTKDRLSASKLRAGLAAASDAARRLVEGSVTEQIELLQRLVEDITVTPTSLAIRLRLDSLVDDGRSQGNHRIATLTVPVELKRCGMAVRLIVPTSDASSHRVDPKLVGLLAKAHAWREQLTTGNRRSIKEIAVEQGVGSGWVARVVHLGCLAPDIVERIVQGRQPPGLSADRLLRSVPLPLDWTEQRRILGFPTSAEE